jgi:hypothetical protein
MSGYSEPTPATDDWLTRFSLFIGRVIPDAMSTAIGMLLLLALWALAIGNSGTAIMDAFYRGLWMLLPFTMGPPSVAGSQRFPRGIHSYSSRH